MANTPLDERKFTDREVREILKKAVEHAPSRALANREGLSLSDLKAIGEEVGIDPARLEDAARTVALGGQDRRKQILGGPTLLNCEHKVQGEFDPEDTAEILSVIRRIMGRQGEAGEIHGSLEWRATGDSGERYVSIASRDGTTTIRSSTNLSNTAILTYLPVGILGAIGSLVGLVEFAKSGSEVGLVVFFAVLPVYAILRTIFSRVSASESAKLQRVVDELARLTGGGEEC